jgi:HD-GYP domain-containing protein (c-di-GMP phosphodiesterase class II)
MMSNRPDELSLVELLGAISLATDLGTGQPYSHGVRTSVLAVQLGRELGLDDDAVADVQQVALLRFLGCTADASDTAELVGGDEIAFLAAMAPVAMGSKPEMGRRLMRTVGAEEAPWRRARLVVGALAQPDGAKRSLSAHCEVAAMLAERLQTVDAVRSALAHAYERWDGGGFPAGLAGDAVPLPVRVAVVARDADLLWRSSEHAMAEVLLSRRGRAYDPAVVDACLAVGPAVLHGLDGGDPWEAMLAADPARQPIGGSQLDTALSAVADFVDLKSRWTRGHSSRVAQIASAAAVTAGLTAAEVVQLRRAGFVHDLGRVGVPAAIWDRPGSLGAADWERVRLHSYLTERTLACCPTLEKIGRVAGAHHERLDGSGYHRGSHDLSRAEWILAVADVVAAAGEDRPYRPALAPNEIASLVAADVRAGRLDRAASDAVLAAAGHTPRAASRGAWPAGLSDREVEVLALIARGRTNKEVAAQLHLSPKTVGRHIENIYVKTRVNSRAGAAVFAMEHRLLDR